MAPAELKAWREKRDLTQADLAKLLNETPKRTVENWEGGTRKPPRFLELALNWIDAQMRKEKSNG